MGHSQMPEIVILDPDDTFYASLGVYNITI